jgi:hypothetical protein
MTNAESKGSASCRVLQQAREVAGVQRVLVGDRRAHPEGGAAATWPGPHLNGSTHNASKRGPPVGLGIDTNTNHPQVESRPRAPGDASAAKAVFGRFTGLGGVPVVYEVGGIASANACRTVRRCRSYFSASSRTEHSSTGDVRLIAATNVTLDATPP